MGTVTASACRRRVRMVRPCCLPMTWLAAPDQSLLRAHRAVRARRTRRGRLASPLHVQPVGEPWPLRVLEARVVTWQPHLRVPHLAEPAVEVEADLPQHLAPGHLVRVPAAHLGSPRATSPDEGCCGPAALKARAMPISE